MDRLNVRDVYAGAIYQLDDIGLPVPFPQGITVENTATFTGSVGVCDQTLRVNTVSSCDGTSKVNFPTGINTSTVVTAELQAPPSGTIVISGSNVTVSGPVYIRNLTITQELSVCNSTAKMNSIESCNGGPVDFTRGILIEGVPLYPYNATDQIINGDNVTFVNGSTVTISSSSILQVLGLASLDGDAIVRNLSVSQSLAIPTFNSTLQGGLTPPTELYPILADLKPHLFWDNGTAQLLVCIGFVNPPFAATCQRLKPVDTYTSNGDITFTYTGLDNPGFESGTELEASLTPTTVGSFSCGPLCTIGVDSKGRATSYSRTDTLAPQNGTLTLVNASNFNALSTTINALSVFTPNGVVATPEILNSNFDGSPVKITPGVATTTVAGVGGARPNFSNGARMCNASTTLEVNNITSCDGSSPVAMNNGVATNTVSPASGTTVNVAATGGLFTSGGYVADSTWKISNWFDQFTSFSANDIYGTPHSQPNEYFIRFYYNDSTTISQVNNARYITVDMRVTDFVGPPPSIPEVDGINIYLTGRLDPVPGSDWWSVALKSWRAPRGISGLRISGVSAAYGRPFGDNTPNPDMFIIRYYFSPRVPVSELYDKDNYFDNGWRASFTVFPGKSVFMDESGTGDRPKPKSTSLPRGLTDSMKY